MTPIRLFLIDDHVLFRESLSRYLTAEPDFVIAAQAGSLAEAATVLPEHPADVVLLDFALGAELGVRFFQLARQLKYEGRVLLVTAGMSALEIEAAIDQGAAGIFLKHSSPSTLVEAIRTVHRGEAWLDPRLGYEPRRPLPVISPRAFTSREQEVLRGVMEGLGNKEIAARLGVSESAVKAGLQQLFTKTGVRTRAQLVRIALEPGLLPR